MKTQTKMTTLFLAATLLLGCNENELTPTTPLNLDYSIVDGDTVKTTKTKDHDKMYGWMKNSKQLVVNGDTTITYKAPKLHTPPNKDPDLTKIKNDKDATLKGKPLTMVVIGGSLAAGVRDAGYFNEGILTSFPNLMARQMKLKKFEQPLFDATEYNGIGRKVKTGNNIIGGPLQKYNIVQNNLAATYDDSQTYDFQKVKLTKYKGDADNLAIPYNSRTLIDTDGFGDAYRDRITGQNEKNQTLSIKNHLKTKKFDFFVIETGMDDAIGFLAGTGNNRIWSNSQNEMDYINDENPNNYIYWQPELKLIRDVLAPSGAKGVFLNIPDVLDFPFFLNKEWVENYDLIVKPYLQKMGIIDAAYSYLPSPKLDSLLSPKVHIALKPITDNNRLLINRDYVLNDSYSGNDVNKLNTGIKKMNDQLERYKQKYGYPIVDIRSIYKSIVSVSGYRSDDGTIITSKNFFSSDGINPTPLGQAVIANEVIKVINSFYKTEIELIPTREYLEIK